MLEIEIYTFQQDSSVQVGYPRGWAVAEHEYGATITEKESADSAGIDILIMALQPGIETSQNLALALLDSLRQSTYPDLQVIQQQPHPQSPEMWTVEATFTANDLPFQGHAWCMANPETGVGVFATFYAPRSRYPNFSAQQVLFACLGPLFGYPVQPETQPAAAPTTTGPVEPAPTPAAGLSSSPIPSSVEREIWFLRQDGENRILYSLDASTGQPTYQGNFKDTRAFQPTRSVDGNVIVLTLPGGRHLMVMNTATNQSAILQLAQSEAETHLDHPSVSRDGQLVTARIRTYRHVGSVNVHDWSSGAYDHTYMAIAHWVKVASFDLETQKEHAVYYQDPDLPDVTTEIRGLGPTFSPTEDVLAYGDSRKIYLCDSITGRPLRELPWPEKYPVSEFSGLAFSPDGNRLAYLSSVQRGGVFEGATAYVIVTVDLDSGAGRPFLLADTVRPFSSSTGRAGTICLDFSPDGRYIAFTGMTKAADEWWALAELSELSMEEQSTDIYALDLQTGQCHRLTADGKNFDPVWKGR